MTVHTLTNTVTGEKRPVTIDEDLPPLTPALGSSPQGPHRRPRPTGQLLLHWPRAHLDPDRGGVWTCGEWENPGPSRFSGPDET